MSIDPSVPQQKHTAGSGKHVVVALILISETERLEFDIVSDEYADFEAGYLGAGTPLARAIEGLAAGQAAPYHLGEGKLVRVIWVEPSKNPPPKEIAARRQETLRKAVEHSNRTNAMMFASSFSGKWGDYDPAALEGDEPDEEEA